MSKKAKKKARAKTKDEQNEHPDDGTEVYDDDDEDDWVEDEKAAKERRAHGEPAAPEEHVGSTEEETREMPEPATAAAPEDPKDQPQVPKDYDIAVNEPERAADPDKQEKYKEPPAPIPGAEPPKTLGDSATEPQPQQLQPGERGKKED